MLSFDDFNAPFGGFRSPVELIDARFAVDVLSEASSVIENADELIALFIANKPVAAAAPAIAADDVEALISGFLALPAPEADGLGEPFLPELPGFAPPAPELSLFSSLDWMTSVMFDFGQADYLF
jgi:hypothetical protein